MPLPASRSPFPFLTRLLRAVLVLLHLFFVGIVHAQSEESVVDILVVYTTAAKEAGGGEANIETRIDEMVVSANTAFHASGANLQLRLVCVEELDYVETNDSDDLWRLRNPHDGHMDEVHALRDAVGADLVHLVERWGIGQGRFPYCGLAYLGGSYGATVLECGSIVFAHEVGHNFGLSHDRYAIWNNGGRLSGSAYGYVNQAMFEAGAPALSRWVTIMAYVRQCAGRGNNFCTRVNRFSNPDRTYHGDPLGVAEDQRPPPPEMVGPADARSKLNARRETVAAFKDPPTTPVVVSLKRRQPAVETTNANELRWRLAFNMDVQNVTSEDFQVEGLNAPTLTVTPKTGSQRIYDIKASGGGLDDLNATVTLEFASDQDIMALDNTALDTAWPAAAQRSYSLDNTATQPTISPSTAGSSPFTATIRFDKDVTDFDDAGDVTATNATVAAPSRSDVRTYTVQVTPTAGATTITLTVQANAAQDELGNGNATADGQIAYDTAHARSLTISGLADTEVAENANWTSAAPTADGDPAGTVTWIKEGTDVDHFTIDASNGVLSLAAQDFESPADANADHAYEVTVRAVDASGNTATQAITVTVTDAVENINQTITFSGPDRILENFGFEALGWLAKNPIGEEKWRIIPNEADAEYFELVERTIYGTKYHTLKMKLLPNYENTVDANADNFYEVSLEATDDDGNVITRNLRVEVVDQQESRTLGITGLLNTTIRENTLYTSATPTVTGNPVGRVMWTTEGADAHVFTIDASNGVLSLAAQDDETPVDENRNNSYEVTVRVTDEDDNTATRDLTITVVSAAPITVTGDGSSRDDHGNTPARATRIAPTGRTTGQLNTTRDVDYFEFTVPQAGVLVVETTGSTDTVGTVWQDGEELATADRGGERQNFRLSARVAARPVVLAVRGNGRQTGRYTVQTALVAGYLENPGPNSFQSGVGLISGWVCEAEEVLIEINGTPQPAAYGTERPDTAKICGDTDNGFGLLFNWNELGDGEHTVVALVDGVELGRAAVTVTTLGEPFVRGLTGEYVVTDFPSPGETVWLVWQEGQQNFVIMKVK